MNWRDSPDNISNSVPATPEGPARQYEINASAQNVSTPSGILFLNTFTRLKIVNYEHVSAFATQHLGWPRVVILPAHKLARIRSAVEDTGSAAGNARQKVDESDVFVRLMESDPAFRLHVTRSCESLGVQITPHTVFFGGDDTCLHLPDDIWQAFTELDVCKMVSSALVAESHQESVRYTVGNEELLFRGPGVNTTYFLSAIGCERYRDALYAAARRNGTYNTYPILRRTTLTVRSLAEPHTIRHFVGTEVVTLLPQTHCNREAFPSRIFVDHAFLASADDPSTAISDRDSSYFGMYDSYARAYQNFVAGYFGSGSVAASATRVPPTRASRRPAGRDLHVRQMSPTPPGTAFSMDRLRRPLAPAPARCCDSPMTLLNLDASALARIDPGMLTKSGPP